MRHLIATAVLTLSSSAIAETWTVDDDGPADFDTIQAAIDAASDGDDILVAAGTYTGDGAWVVNPNGKAIMIRAVDWPEDTFIFGNFDRQGVVFINGETADTMLVGFTIIGCRTSNGAGIMCISSSPTIINCVIKNNIATASGGGIYCGNFSSPTFTDCTITDNTAGGQYGGGGIRCHSSSPTISDCTITNNTAAVGGGIACFWHDSDPTIIGCTIENNTASGTSGGGGIFCAIYTNPSLASTTLCGNDPDQIVGDWTDEGGNAVADECYPSGACCIETSCSTETAADCSAAGGKYIGDGSTCSGDPCGSKNTTWTVDDDGPADFDTIQAAIDAASYGDEILVAAGTYTSTADSVLDTLGKALTVQSTDGADSTIIDGQSIRRGMLFDKGEGAGTVIDGFTISNCAATPYQYPEGTYSDGGGMQCVGASPQVRNCVFIGNSAEYGAGAHFRYTTAVMTGCQFVANMASGKGGAAYTWTDGNVRFEGCVIQSNTAAIDGGGINDLSTAAGQPVLVDTTVCDNSPNQIVGDWTDEGGNAVADECYPSGACCIETSCSTETAADCSAAGGKYIGDGSTCSGDPCGSGNTTWTVDDDGPADFDNIQAAVDAASDGDDILVAAGTYTSDGAWVVNPNGKAITIRANGVPEETIIDGEDQRQVVLCNSGEASDTVIQGFTITGGNDEGGGGGVHCYDGSSPTIVGCTISNNRAGSSGVNGRGGGVYCSYDGNPTLVACTITNNYVGAQYGYGGGIACFRASPTIMNCTISDNATGGWGWGGGIWCGYDSSPTIAECTISDNAAREGGGVNCYDGSSPIITDCVIESNTTIEGGGIYCNNSSPIIEGCTIAHNSANSVFPVYGFGGGIYSINGSHPAIINCTISNNIATGVDDDDAQLGGGIFCLGGSPSLMDTTVCGNAPDQILGSWINSGGNTITDECPPDCTGDLDGDGEVGVDDVLALLAAYQLNADGDCDGDGDTDVDDLLVLISAWGPCP